MAADAPTLIGVALASLAVGAAAIKLAQTVLSKKEQGTTSGGQDVSFWIAEFQDVKDKIQGVKEAVREGIIEGDIDRTSIEASVEAVQHTVDRIEQKIQSRRR
jgi:hypothetical protein